MDYKSINLIDIPVHYINLKKDIEKNTQIVDNLNQLGFKNITRHEGIPHEKPYVGCSRSHHMVLSKLKPPFILFEDDIVINNFSEIIKIPINADAVYLGNSSWGRKNSCSGPFLEYEKIDEQLYRIYNMLSAHAVLYLSQCYKAICEKISYNFGYVYMNYQDIGFAEIQKYYNVYCFNESIFFQSSNLPATNKKLVEYDIIDSQHKKFYLPYK